MKIVQVSGLALATLLCCGGISRANPVDFVNVADNVYGNFSGFIDSAATGSAAKLDWNSAVYGNGPQFWDIYFTNASNTITDVLLSGSGVTSTAIPGDALEFDGSASKNTAIGGQCVSGTYSACLVATGAFQDITALVAALSLADGGAGICCGTSSIAVEVGDQQVPEPAAMLLLATALIGLGALRYRKHA